MLTVWANVGPDQDPNDLTDDIPEIILKKSCFEKISRRQKHEILASRQRINCGVGQCQPSIIVWTHIVGSVSSMLHATTQGESLFDAREYDLPNMVWKPSLVTCSAL